MDNKSTNPIRYQWLRDEAGHEWHHVRMKGVRRNDPLLVLAASARRLHTRPKPSLYTAPPDLFEIFSRIDDANRDAIKAFADDYGVLGLERGDEILIGMHGTVKFNDDAVSGTDWSGELLSSWQIAIRYMRRSLKMWRSIERARKGDALELSSHVKWDPKWDGGRGYVSVHPDPSGSIDFRAWRGSEMAQFKIGDVLGPAEEFLRGELNLRLHERMSASVEWVEGTPRNFLARVFRPSSLLGLMWLQLADAFTGETTFRYCKNPKCSRLILISPEGAGKRGHAETCSDKCRFEIYQRRIREAIEAFDRGESVNRIASRLVADSLTVKRWIARELTERGSSVREIAARLGLGSRKVADLIEKKKRTFGPHNGGSANGKK